MRLLIRVYLIISMRMRSLRLALVMRSEKNELKSILECQWPYGLTQP